MKLLLAEDTRDLNHVVTTALTHSGYDVDSAFDGEEALDLILRNGYDGIILDIMMPKMDGLEVLAAIRSRGIHTPVLLLTAKAEVDDRVTGLDAGADDYLTKPFALKELLARVRAMTRRRTEYTGSVLTYGDIRLDGQTFELSAENSVRLSVKEFELLQVLIQSAGQEVSSDYLLKAVWAEVPAADGDTLWLYISYLKGKLRSVASSVTIEGQRGGGFRLLP